MESLDVGRSHFTFPDIEADAGLVAELLHYIKECDHFLNGIGDQRAIVRVPFADQSEAARCYVISHLRGIESSCERFDH